jgi:outer membrane protein assembly factor BamB
LAKKSEATIPAPVCGDEMVILCSGNRPIQPIVAIKPGATGEILWTDENSKHESVLWGTLRGGPYMPTPILYKEYFYTCSNSGVVACYKSQSGDLVYKKRMGDAGESYTASPVAADGRIYFCSEQGIVRVVKAGPAFELLAVNDMSDYVMATPAISNGTIFIRTQHALVAVGARNLE